MRIFVETNFILELAFMQEEHESCTRILTLCEAGDTDVILPAFCIAESYETLIRRVKRRTQLANELAGELQQLARSAYYRHETDAFQNITGLLARSLRDEDQGLSNALHRLLRVARIIPLDVAVMTSAEEFRSRYRLQPQDAIVCASVLQYLSEYPGDEGCFVNKNRRDFDDPDIVERLAAAGCKILFSFAAGENYARYRLLGRDQP
jgi:predicted nucleic acid-binding protein